MRSRLAESDIGSLRMIHIHDRAPSLLRVLVGGRLVLGSVDDREPLHEPACISAIGGSRRCRASTLRATTRRRSHTPTRTAACHSGRTGTAWPRYRKIFFAIGGSRKCRLVRVVALCRQHSREPTYHQREPEGATERDHGYGSFCRCTQAYCAMTLQSHGVKSRTRTPRERSNE